jgi:tRNA dimethylallyltransferase
VKQRKLLKEVQTLLDNGLNDSCQCMQGIGYKEVVEGFALGQSEEEIKELIKKNTRNYAKRQITFFKRMENHTLLAPERATAEEVLKLL